MPRMEFHHNRHYDAYRALHPYVQPFISVHLQHQLQYLKYSEPLELTAAPLDLSLKNQTPITPPCTPSPGGRRPKCTTSPEPEQPIKKHKSTSQHQQQQQQLINKKTKVTRKLNFDEDTSSPVSGTIIRELDPGETLVVRKGDIDPALNVVEVTEEAKAELAKIENHIGDYVCRLCRELYEDAFGLAQHRCSRIVHVEYRCPECDKLFNCPANLASHRRWHKPKKGDNDKEILLVNHKQSLLEDSSNALIEDGGGGIEEQYSCDSCSKTFRRLSYLKRHQMVHQQNE